MAGVPLDRLRVTSGEEHLTLYQWNMKIAKHYFCSKCGIYTHHQRRSNPNEFGFNVACIEGAMVEDYRDAETMGDGRAMSLVTDAVD